jgi:chloride channel protein, CIC family
VSMGAILGGTMRSPFTGVIFALELTHDVNMLLPLLLAVTVAHGFTVLTLRRSILTEKVARRGYHLSREYAVDPLEILFVREVMRTNIAAIPPDVTPNDLTQSLHTGRTMRKGQFLYPVVDEKRRVVGVATRNDLEGFMHTEGDEDRSLAELVRPEPVMAFQDEPLRVVAYRMAETGLTRFPVVNNDQERKLVGMVALADLLRARTRSLEEERHRERVLRLHLP